MFSILALELGRLGMLRLWAIRRNRAAFLMLAALSL
jgi:hypothetical protein